MDIASSPQLISRRLVLGGVAGGVAASAVSTSPAYARSELIRVRLRADGTDQSARLQRQIDRAPDGSHLRLPSGSYRLDQRIVISHRRGLTISGPPTGSRRRRRRSNQAQPFEGYTDLTGFDVGDVSADGRYSYRQHWQVANSHDITLLRIGVRGPNRRREGNFTTYQQNVAFEHAFCVNAPSTGVRVLRCRFRDVNGDGVYIGGMGDPCRNITVARVSGEYCGRQSIGITNVDGLEISDVTISGGGRSGVDIEPNGQSQFVRNVQLTRLDMGSRFYPYVIGGHYDVVRRENITLLNCTAHASSSSHPAVLATRNGRNLRILGHQDRRQGSRFGVIATSWTGVEVADSSISWGRHTPTTYGVGLTNCDGDLRLVGNDFGGPEGGFDELFEAVGSTDATSVVQTGNTWARR